MILKTQEKEPLTLSHSYLLLNKSKTEFCNSSVNSQSNSFLSSAKKTNSNSWTISLNQLIKIYSCKSHRSHSRGTWICFHRENFFYHALSNLGLQFSQLFFLAVLLCWFFVFWFRCSTEVFLSSQWSVFILSFSSKIERVFTNYHVFIISAPGIAYSCSGIV